MEVAPALRNPPPAHVRLRQELDAGAHAARRVGRFADLSSAPSAGADRKRRRTARPLPHLRDKHTVGNDGRRATRPRRPGVQDAAGKHHRVHAPGQPHHHDVPLAAICAPGQHVAQKTQPLWQNFADIH